MNWEAVILTTLGSMAVVGIVLALVGGAVSAVFSLVLRPLYALRS